VDAEELENVLDFMYEGEARIEKQRLDTFLQCAQDLQIMGLVSEENLTFRSVLPIRLMYFDDNHFLGNIITLLLLCL
jgi:hypothetical protein